MHLLKAGGEERIFQVFRKEMELWCKYEMEIEGAINDYFQKLFTSSDPKKFESYLVEIMWG